MTRTPAAPAGPDRPAAPAGPAGPPLRAAGRGGPRIGIVDYGMGNRRSVEKALAHVGAEPVLSADHDVLRAADGLVVPGVGAFPEAMLRLAAAGLDELIIDRVAAGVPTLGVCLGMQLAFEHSTEHDGSAGLGIVPGTVRELRAAPLKVPHIGWSRVRWRAASPPACPSRARTPRHGALLDGLPDEAAFYHVHSYVADPTDPADWLGTTEYGERFVTAVARGSFWGVQFHPEKSSTRGLRLLANFAALCAAGPGELESDPPAPIPAPVGAGPGEPESDPPAPIPAPVGAGLGGARSGTSDA
ncbi:MAG: imidazole glycerol-phosphate synthase subunit HisH [Solirubrobacteraceae bacterium]|nr:imidazole glycerol-phosphate synthase subunit HisH [Solirubrobacteraceae bacterium]